MTTPKKLRDCIDCGRALRPMKADKSEWPGTLIHQGRGLCSKDYHERQANGTLKDIAPLQAPRKFAEVDPLSDKRIEAMRRHMREWHRPRLTARGITWDGDLTAMAMGKVAA